jgi:hypothetical protein
MLPPTAVAAPIEEEEDDSTTGSQSGSAVAASSALPEIPEEVGEEEVIPPAKVRLRSPSAVERNTQALRSFFHGFILTKHGRQGSPKRRIVWIDARHNDIVIRWGPPSARQVNHPPTPIESLAEEEPRRLMKFAELSGVSRGRSTAILRRSAAKVDEATLVSLIGDRRSLDLQFDSSKIAAEFATAMECFISDRAAFEAALMYLYNNGLLPDDYAKPGRSAEEPEDEDDGYGYSDSPAAEDSSVIGQPPGQSE